MVSESKKDEKHTSSPSKIINRNIVSLILGAIIGAVPTLWELFSELQSTNCPASTDYSTAFVPIFGLGVTGVAILCMTYKTTILYEQYLQKFIDYIGLFCSGFSLSVLVIKLCWPIFVDKKHPGHPWAYGLILVIFVVVLVMLEVQSRRGAKSADTPTTESTDTTTTDTTTTESTDTTTTKSTDTTTTKATEKGSAAQENVTKQE